MGYIANWFILQGLFFQQNKLTLPFLHTFPLRFFSYASQYSVYLSVIQKVTFGNIHKNRFSVMNIRDIFGFRKHRRTTERLRHVAFGHAATVCGTMVTLIAFCILRILIMRCAMDHDPHRILAKQIQNGNVVIERLNAYRDSCGVFPESLESIGLHKTYQDNIFLFPTSYSVYHNNFEYIRLNDTSFYLGDEDWYGGREQYLSSEGRWRMVEYDYDDYSGQNCPYFMKDRMLLPSICTNMK